MAKEYRSTAYLKPTGAWLTTANEYYADHPSFRNVDPADTYGTWRLKSSDTPGNKQVANVWEWTGKKCRLCDLDYVVVSADPFILRQLSGEYYSCWGLGKVRLELAVDREFSQGFFVEWEIQKHAEFASLADTMVDAAYGQNPYGTDPLGSIFGDRTAWFNHGGSYGDESDISPLCLVSFPSWVTQQASGTQFGIDAFFNQAAFANRLEWPIYLRFLSDHSGQPVTFLRSVMKFGAIGGTPQEVPDYGCQMLRKQWGGVGLRHVCLSLGVHNNVCGASANDTFFSTAITGQDWLVKKRYARVITETASQNDFLITGRKDTFQRRHPSNFNPSFTGDSAVTALATSPRVLEVNAYSLAGADGVASPKTQGFADAATRPTQLLYQPTHDPRDVGFISSTANKATSFTASRIRSAATLSQPTGQVRAIQHDSYAQGKSLQVSVECVIGSVARTDNNGGSTPNGNDDAFLPSVALLDRNVAGSTNRKSRIDTTGSNPSGWPVDIEFEEAERSAVPNQSDYMDGTYVPVPTVIGGEANLLSRSEFEAFVNDYADWIKSPTGGGSQSLATPGSSAKLCEQDCWQYVYAQMPNAPWFRHPIGTSPVSLANNAGQSVYIAAGLPAGPSYTPVPTLALPAINNANIADLLQLSGSANTFALGNLAPATYDGSRLHQNTTGSLEVQNSYSALKTTYTYDLWPQSWSQTADPWDGGTLIPTSNWYDVHTVQPTQPTWEALANTTPARQMAAITDALYTPIQFECVAFLDTATVAADSILSPSEAVNELAIDNYDALHPAVVPTSKPGEAIVVIHWRRTWRADLTVTAGPVAVNGTNSAVNRGRLVDLAQYYPQTRNFVLDPYKLSGIALLGRLPLSALTDAFSDYQGSVNDVAYFGDSNTSPPPDRLYKWDGASWVAVDDVWQSSQVNVESLNETVEITWPGQAAEKDYSFLFHDQWCTSIGLTASEWQQLQEGQAVTVWMRDTSGIESKFERGIEGDTRVYGAAAGFNYVESGLRPERHTWSVEAQLKLTLQFV